MKDSRSKHHLTVAALAQTGYIVLDPYDQSSDSPEWLELDYLDGQSSGTTRIAPLASAHGDMECEAFSKHKPPRADKDGVWVQGNAAKAPRLVARAKEPGANIGRCRVMELQSNSYVDAVRNLHLDDNNYLNPVGTGWTVRGFYNLSDDPGSVMVLRENPTDPSTETRVPLPAGTQMIIDTQRLWHAVWHVGPKPRYCLTTSWESGPELGRYIDKHHGASTVASSPIDNDLSAAAMVAHDKLKHARRIEWLRWELRRFRHAVLRR